MGNPFKRKKRYSCLTVDDLRYDDERAIYMNIDGLLRMYLTLCYMRTDKPEIYESHENFRNIHRLLRQVFEQIRMPEYVSRMCIPPEE